MMDTKNKETAAEKRRYPEYWVGYVKDMYTGFGVDPVYPGETWYEGVGEEYKCRADTESEAWAMLNSMMGFDE